MLKLSRFAVTAIILAAIVALLAVPTAARTDLNTIQSGDTVFVYESGLNVAYLSPGLNMADLSSGYLPTKFVKYSNDNPDSTVPGGGIEEAEIPCDSPGILSVYTEPAYSNSAWFAWNASYNDPKTGHANRSQYIYIRDADIGLDVVLANSHIDSLNGDSVTRATNISFKLTSNYASSYYTIGNTHYAQVNIQITTPGGGTVSIFGGNAVNLQNINLSGLVMYTDQIPGLDQISLSGVEPGTYTAEAAWADTMPWYNQEPNSNAVTFTVISKVLSITTNEESVVAGNDFVVTVTGESEYDYYVYIKGGSSSGYPQVLEGQPNVNDTADAQSVIENYVSDDAGVSGTLAIVTTDVSGTQTVEFNTNDVAADTNTEFTIKVIDPLDSSNYDTVSVEVQQGQVTLSMGGTGIYYMGDVINLAGTSTSGNYVYLFLTGPNLNNNGVKLDDATTPVTDNDTSTFTAVGVNADTTWSYKWDTSSLGRTLDTGTYTIYAVDYPAGRDSLGGHQYETASVIIEQGFITANSIANTIAAGDNLIINGTAAGANDVYVWIFGPNYRSLFNPVTVQDDGTYSYEIDNINLYVGQYYVVVQHPMANGPGVKGSDSYGNECSGTDCYGMVGTNLGLVGLSGLQASDAATALQSALASSYIDDVYAWTTFTINNPYITLDPIPDKYADQSLAIHGTTNLASGDQIQINVVSLAFTPTTKTQSNEFSAAANTVTVYHESNNTYNEFNASFDISNFQPGEYTVEAQSVTTGVDTTTNFNVLEGVPTTIPTPIPTAPPTPPPTQVQTVLPTAVPTPIPTTTSSPGFDTLIALIGLCALATFAVRRQR